MEKKFEIKFKSSEKKADEIYERAQKASSKVSKRAIEFFVPKVRGEIPTLLLDYMNYLRGDFIRLIKDPKDPIGDGVYDDWSREEVAELFFVLFGNVAPDWWLEK